MFYMYCRYRLGMEREGGTIRSQLSVDMVEGGTEWAGGVQCTASNRFGQDTTTFHIIVEG